MKISTIFFFLALIFTSFESKLNVESCSFNIELIDSSNRLNKEYNLFLEDGNERQIKLTPNSLGVYSFENPIESNINMILEFDNLRLKINNLSCEKIGAKLNIYYSQFKNTTNDSNEKMLRHKLHRRYGKFSYVVFQDGTIKNVTIIKPSHNRK